MIHPDDSSFEFFFRPTPGRWRWNRAFFAAHLRKDAEKEEGMTLRAMGFPWSAGSLSLQGFGGFPATCI